MNKEQPTSERSKSEPLKTHGRCEHCNEEVENGILNWGRHYEVCKGGGLGVTIDIYVMYVSPQMMDEIEQAMMEYLGATEKDHQSGS